MDRRRWMKIARVFEVIGVLMVCAGCYLVLRDNIAAVVVAYIGLTSILVGAQIEERKCETE